MDERAPGRRAHGLTRQATARASATVGDVRLAGLKAMDAARLAGLKSAIPIAAVSLAVVLWLISLDRIDPRAMTDVGLISVLPATYFAGLLLLTASFVALALRRPASTPLLGAHVLALIVFLHATPAIVYGTLRYAWAWKHLGIVDYIITHGGVAGAPGIEHLDVYHYWPSFFGLGALLQELAGLDDLIEVATWAPVFNNLMLFGALLFVFSALTRDRRVIWLGTWLFFIANWIGQDYFSPQALAYFFYLLILGTALRWLRLSPEDGRPIAGSPLATGSPDAAAQSSRLRSWWAAQLRSERLPRRLALAFIVLALVLITTSHALTSGMVTVALGALVLARVCSVRSLPLIAGGIVVLWAIVFASPYIIAQGSGVLESVRLPWLQAEQSLAQVGEQSAGQQLVTNTSRLAVVAVAALAGLGVLRLYRAGRLDRAPVVLAAVPVLLFAGGDYGGEILFRIFLFAVPFLAFLGAYAFLPRAGLATRSWWPVIAATVGCTALLGAFVFVYYGKEHHYYFTPQEAAASEYLYDHAPPNSFLVDGTANYPRVFEHYDEYSYLDLSVEPRPSQRKFLARPASVLSGWMSDPQYSRSFLTITRSQKAEVSDLGVMPPHSLRKIEDSLLRSPRFRVWYRNRDAIIFTLAKEGGSA
jgi:hypothetical protein